MGSPDFAIEAAIKAVLHRYSRALDRMDKSLALTCWHDDGTDDHRLHPGSSSAAAEALAPEKATALRPSTAPKAIEVNLFDMI